MARHAIAERLMRNHLHSVERRALIQSDNKAPASLNAILSHCSN